MANLFLDQQPQRPSPYTQTTRSATFIEQYEPGWGQVRIEDGDATSLVDVRLLPGVYAKGAQVGVVCGHDGRPIHATPPNTMAADASPIGVGTSGEYTLEAKTEAGEARRDASDALADSTRAGNAAREAIEAAKKAWDEAILARESIAGVDSSAQAAMQAANNAQVAADLTQQALDAAKEAQRLENESLSARADAAQTSADEAGLAAQEARSKADELAQHAQDAMEVAKEAQASADGKALVAYSTYQPATVSGQKIIWFEPGSTPKLFDGNVWRSIQPGDGVVEALDIGTATVGELSGMRIKAGTASVDILIPGENARWTSSGLTIYHPLTPEDIQAGLSPTDWEKRAIALNLTSEGSRFISVADEAGMVTAYMSPQGEVSGRELTITGNAAVDTLEVGGIDIQDLIALQSDVAAFVEVPPLMHPAGFDSIIVAETDWMELAEGLYEVSWPISGILTRGGTSSDAVGGYLELEARNPNSGSESAVNWHHNQARASSWLTMPNDLRYFQSMPHAVLEAKTPDVYRLRLGLHSYQKWKVQAYSSLLTVRRLPDYAQTGYTLISQPTPPEPPPPPRPKRVTKSVGLSNIWYAYGNVFAQSGSYSSGGNFRIPGAKGKKIRSIKVTGKCNFDFMDAGQGRTFSYHLGGENRSQFLRDYGTVNITFGATAAAALSRNGYVGFRVNSGAPAYTTYNAGSFRCTVVYE